MEKKSFFRRPTDASREERVERPAREESVARVVRRPRAERDERAARVERPSSLNTDDWSESVERPTERPAERPFRGERGERPRAKSPGKDFRKSENRAPKEQRSAPENTIFGTHPVREALQAGQALEKIYMRKGATGGNGTDILTEIENMASEAGINVQYVPIEKLDKLVRRANHQGIVAITAAIEYAELNDILEGEPKFILLLDGITDVRNFGAIARSAECAGVDAIIVGAKSCAPINGEAMKSSAGALSRISVCRAGSVRLAALAIQNAGIKIVASTEKGSQSLFEADLTGRIAIVMGSEERGISSEILKIADAKVSIPMEGSIESLNVSAAAAVILFETLRQRSVETTGGVAALPTEHPVV